MRALVTLRTVSELRPIEGADLIELALIDGWQCVVKKNEFKVGDRGLYFEIDSFIPLKDERFKFLEKNATTWKGKYGARIKTIKLKGQVSQGLLLPLSSFPELRTYKWGEKDYSTDLGVVKWEREDAHGNVGEKKSTWLGKKLKKLKHTRIKPLILWLERTFPGVFLTNATRPFPSFIPKTDEERIQNLINKLSLEDIEDDWERTVKLDGSSMTAYHNKGRVGVCSRNLDLKKDSENKFWQTAIEYNLDKALKKLGKNIAVQGELMGPGIQGNREQLKEYEFYVFNVYLIDEKRYAGKKERDQLLVELHELGARIKQVPNLGIGNLQSFKTIDDYLAYAEGPSLVAKTREGVVFSTLDGTKSFKVISNSYLLKHGE